MNHDFQVKYQDGERLAKEYNIVFLETSARTGVNVDLAFDAVAREIYSKSLSSTELLANSKPESFNLQNYIASESRKTSCC